MLGALGTVLRKAGSRLKRQGLIASLHHYFGSARQAAHQLAYDRWLDRLERNPSGVKYVASPGEFAGPAPPEAERLYQAFPRLPFLWSLAALDIDPEKYTFVDYGSGRGRLLLAAGLLPFRRIIGVELAHSLHEDACENIANYSIAQLQCRDITSLNIDALEFDLPEGNVVAFFFNPFPEDVLRRVANQIAMSCHPRSRSVRIIFAGRDRVKIFSHHPSYRAFLPRLAYRARLHALAPVPISFFSWGTCINKDQFSIDDKEGWQPS